jgi:hypothetical protein
MISPNPADIGRAVAYRGNSDTVPEIGIITSFDQFFVFVRYGAEPHSRATKASHLEWVGPASSASSHD